MYGICIRHITKYGVLCIYVYSIPHNMPLLAIMGHNRVIQRDKLTLFVCNYS